MLPLVLPHQTPSVIETSSPSGKLVARFELTEGRPHLSVVRNGRPILEVNAFGFDLGRAEKVGETVEMVRTRRGERDESWRALSGKASQVRNRYRSAIFTLEDSRNHRAFDLELRAYDEGIAFRYRVPKQTGWTSFDAKEERTRFRPLAGATAHVLVLPNERTPYEEPYQTERLDAMSDGTLIGLPLMLTYPDGPAVAITEADLDDYAGLYLRAEHGELAGHLSPRLDDSGLAVRARLPKPTPWRVVMAADRAGDLLESDLVLNLNPPSVIKDTSWIHPGKTVFPWWNGYNTGDSGIAPAQTTEYHKWCIDFAASHGIPYHSIDGLDNVAWYGGRIVPYDGGPLTKGLPGLDLEEIVRYAKSKGVRIRLWMASAAARAQMKVAFPYYEKLGIEGVMVDFFDRDDQETVNFVHEVVAWAAKCHLTITLHNIFKPTGLSRTYPNLLAVEAARNLEFDKWDPTGIAPRHDLTVAYVRALAGPIDYHSGSFRNVLAKDFKPVDKAPLTIGTRAYQLARYVVYEDALSMVADSPAVYAASPAGFDFLREVPTTWDETRFLAGEVGESIVVARRKGRTWYVGAMNGETARRIDLPLAFLGNQRYRVRRWLDGIAPTEVAVTDGWATRKDSISIPLGESGGAAFRFEPER